MYFHQGADFQRGRGFGSLFSGLFRSLVPIAKAGANIGRRVLKSDFVRNLSSQALNVGKDMVKNIAADVIEGKNFQESAENNINYAKKNIAEALRGSGIIHDSGNILGKRKKRSVSTNRKKMKMLKSFNLLD